MLLFWHVAAIAFAHDPGISTAQGELSGNTLSLTTGFAPADARYLLPAEFHGDGSFTLEEFESVRERLLAVAPQLWEVRSGTKVSTVRDLKVELLPGDNVSFQFVFPRPPGVSLRLSALKLPELPESHRQFVIISDENGSVITKKLLKAEDFTLEVPVGEAGSAGKIPTSAGNLATAWEFVKLGIVHIWQGYDHLLFLFALLLVCRTFRSIVAIISCFTVAHSLTLGLATLNLIDLPSRIVEAAIAASIVFVGGENLFRRDHEPRGRWVLTFAFGLIHGFGFASVLRDLGVAPEFGDIALPLFTFNLGVEIGQIAIASVVLPVIWQLRKRQEFVKNGVPVLSGLVACAGLYWLIERTLLS